MVSRSNIDLWMNRFVVTPNLDCVMGVTHLLFPCVGCEPYAPSVSGRVCTP